VVTGSISNEEVRDRSVYGYTQFVAAGWNEGLLESAGFRLIASENRTPSVLQNARGRLSAMRRIERSSKGSRLLLISRNRRAISRPSSSCRRGARCRG
jgi:hypothetical protein